MWYVYSQWYDISCATLYLYKVLNKYIHIDFYIFSSEVVLLLEHERTG